MALMELVRKLHTRAEKQREEERKLLMEIEKLSDYKTAEMAANIYAINKHEYSFDGYLQQLLKLKIVLAAGVPAEIALEEVDSCLDAETIITSNLSRIKEIENDDARQYAEECACVIEGAAKAILELLADEPANGNKEKRGTWE